MDENDIKKIEDIIAHQVSIAISAVSEGLQRRNDKLSEDYQRRNEKLAEDVQRKIDSLSEKFDRKVDSLTAHRADTEMHRREYGVSESKIE